MGADGIKTGYLAVERYSLASSIKRKGRRLIAVGSGFESKNARSRQSLKLLTYGLTNFDLVEINKSDQPIEKIDVWLGKDKQVDVYVKKNIYKTIKKAKKKLIKVVLKYQGPVEAPIKKDDVVGKLRIVYDEELVGEYDLLAAKDVDRVNMFSRLIKSLNYLIWGDV
jgi:D-alanyl-D-alanine carboxypeptidase (penicillin-binding protein 5/6)